MTWMKRRVLAAAGATLIACALSPASAAPLGQAGVEAAKTAAAQSESNVTQAGRRWHGRRHSGWYGHRHRHRHRGGVSLFIAAPIVVGPPAYAYRDYDDEDYRPAPGPGLSCYKQCREEHGPDYCRDYWRRYCRY